MTPLPGGYYLDHRVVLVIKTLLTAIGVALLAVYTRASARGHRRTLDRFLIVLGVIAVLAWTNFGALRGPNRPVALHDFFHYYIGAKYYPELGYTRIYDCMSTAEIDNGHGADVAGRWHRDLETNELIVQVPSTNEQAGCRIRFGDQWNTFRADVEWFREHMPTGDWVQVPMDYGFNATPTWAAITHWLAGRTPVTNGQVISLAILDYLLLAAMCVLIWRTFGPQVWAIATLWWALSEPTGFRWLGGALLRHDALLCIVAGICALKSGRPRGAGIALAAAVLLRAFPVLILAPLPMCFLYRVRSFGLRNAFARYRPIILGFVSGAAILIAVTQATWSRSGMSPTEPWRGFMTKAERHFGTQMTNNVGLQTVLSFSESSRAANVERFWLDGPWDTWKAAQTRVFERRQWFYWPLVVGCVGLLVFAVRNTEEWSAVVLGVTLLPILANLSNYYYSVLLVIAFLWPLDRKIGLALASLSLVSNVLLAFFSMVDDRSVVLSIGLLLLIVWVNYRVAFGSAFQSQRSNGGTPIDVPAVDPSFVARGAHEKS